MSKSFSRYALLSAFAFSASAAMAQDDAPPPPEETVYDGDYLTIGVGGVYGPSYSGSDDYVFYPGGIAIGSFKGIDFQTEGLGIKFDVIPRGSDDRVDLILGPAARLRLDRNDRIKDTVVKQLGKLDKAWEVGGQAGFQVNRVLHDYDSLTVSATALWDVSDAHKGLVIEPSISYFTPLSRSLAFTLSASATHADDDFASYYYSVSPAGNAASGLPVFDAEGGWKSYGANALIAFDLNGNLADGGFGVFAAGGYSRLLNDFADSPLVSIRGDRDQWVAAAGIGYTF